MIVHSNIPYDTMMQDNLDSQRSPPLLSSLPEGALGGHFFSRATVVKNDLPRKKETTYRNENNIKEEQMFSESGNVFLGLEMRSDNDYHSYSRHLRELSTDLNAGATLRRCQNCTKIGYREITVSSSACTSDIEVKQGCMLATRHSKGICSKCEDTEKLKSGSNTIQRKESCLTRSKTKSCQKNRVISCSYYDILHEPLSTMKKIILSRIKTREKASLQARGLASSRIFTFSLILLLSTTLATSAGFTGRSHPPARDMAHGLPRQSAYARFSRKTKTDQCEDIKVDMCRDIGYNKTDMSLSIMNKFSQTEAAEELELFQPLLKVKCSAELKLFLCSMYTPVCMKDYGRFLPPCRFVCERARNGCLPLMKHYGEPWPDILRCEQFPRQSGDGQLCMHFNLTKPGPKKSKDKDKKEKVHLDIQSKLPVVKPDFLPIETTTAAKTTSTTTTTSKKVTTTKSRVKPKPNDRSKITEVTQKDGHSPPSLIQKGISELPILPPEYLPTLNTSLCTCLKPMVLVTDPRDPLYNKVTTGRVPNCAVSCRSPYFTEDQRSLAETWIKTCSVICFVVTLMTVSTFLIDMERFKYPERPIIFLSTCYMFVSIGFLIRIIAGHEAIACASKSDHVLYNTTGPVLCTTVFLLVYFFSMASALWWVILSFTWFLAAGLKWGSEAIASYSQYYHAAAWLIPSLKSIMVLAMSSVDGDSLSGICLVGNQDVRALRGFVLAPLVVYLALGGMFLLAGFISLFRIRSSIKKDGSETDKLEKLMGRIGIFSVLYMVPAAALLACYFYEQKYRPLWEYSHNCGGQVSVDYEEGRIMAKSVGSPWSEDSHSDNLKYDFKNVAHNKPEFSVFIVRYLMTLLIGITNGVWICSNKTVASWKGFYRRCVCCLCGTPCQSSCKDGDKKPGKSLCRDFCNEEAKTSPADGVEDMYPGKSGGTSSSDKKTDNRQEDCLSRKHHAMSTISYEQNGSHAGSRKSSDRRSGKTGSKTCSDNSHLARCESCDRSSRTSRHAARCNRPRRKTSSRHHRNEIGIRAEGARKGENVICDGVCCNNTTTTDSSERVQTKTPASYRCECRGKMHHNKPHSHSDNVLTRETRRVGTPRSPSSEPCDATYARQNSSSTGSVSTNTRRKTSASSSLRECVYQICEEACVCCEENFNMNSEEIPLPSTSQRSRHYASRDVRGPCERSKVSSNSCEHVTSPSSANFEDEEEQQRVSLLSTSPQDNSHSSSYQQCNHYHHHHYLGRAET